MRKTFCDNCGKQCVNTTVVVNVAIVQHTKTGEHVSHDECKPTELCVKCADRIREVVPRMMEIIRREEDNYPRDMEAPIRMPVTQDRMNHE